MTTRRKKRQPTADVMREQLALAADEIIRLRNAMSYKLPILDVSEFDAAWTDYKQPRSWWQRLFPRTK